MTELRLLLMNQLKQAQTAVDVLHPDTLLVENIDVLVHSLVAENFSSELRIEWESATRSPVQEVRYSEHDPYGYGIRSIAASKVTVGFPIDGDGSLFNYQASRFTMAPERLLIGGNSVHVEVTAETLTPDVISASIDRLRRDVDKRVEWINSDIREQRAQAAQILRSAIEGRRKRVLADRELEAALTIPVHTTGRERPVVPARPRQVRLERRREQSQFVPEPVLAESIYQDVLGQVRSWSRTMERAPGTAAKLDEEELRDLLLGTLNAYWAGAAGSELFNGAGKTDILIREGDRNAFIGECKIWTGAKAVTSAIDQLFSYLVWRDSKAALVYFIRTADPATTIARLVAAVGDHPNHVTTKVSDVQADRHEYVFKADDEGRTVSLAVIPVVLGQRP